MARRFMASHPPLLFPELALPEREWAAEHTTGILPSQRIRWLIQAGHLSAAAPFVDDQVQPASIDLRLGPVAYRVRASFLPNQGTVMRRIEEFQSYQLDLRQGAVLERGCVYIVPLLEDLSLPGGYWAKANPKSTIGRLDIFTRLITDRATEFERVPAGYRGPLYLEIVPRTFSVLAREGSRLSQLRFWRGNPLPSDSQLTALHEEQTLLYQDDGSPADPLIAGGIWVSVDLRGVDGSPVVGYRAKRNAAVVDLAAIGQYDPFEFWESIPAGKRRHLTLEPDEFHILVSRERVRIPPGYAAEMVAYDASVGELRVHYAGFFDPGFGFGDDDQKGTRAVLEVRSHDVPFIIEDGQRIARLVYERLQSPPDRLYGPAIGSSYQHQGLRLSKQFRN